MENNVLYLNPLIFLTLSHQKHFKTFDCLAMIKERNYNFKILIDKFVVTFHKINQNKLYILKDYSV